MTQQLEKPSSPAKSPKITYARFLKTVWENAHVEWADGEVIPMAPVSDEHQRVAVFLITILNAWVGEHDLGVVMSEPYQMKTGPNLPGRSPDIFFIARKNLSQLKKTYLDGPADLAIEVISEGSRGVDRGEKFYEYEQGGVREYWLIDPIRKEVEYYQRSRAGRFQLVPADQAGIYHSAVLRGVWIKTVWLWKRPACSTVLREWKLI